jgi:hypothetical protein
MKGIFSIVSVLATSGMVFAQAADTAPAASEPAVQAPAAPAPAAGEGAFAFKNFMVSEDVNFFNLDSGDIVEFSTTFSWSLADNVGFKVTAPVYTDGDTGLGMVNIGASILAIQNPTSWINGVSFGVGIELPAANDDFGGDSLNTKLSAGTDGKTGIDKLSWCAGIDGTFVSDATYLPVFGGLVSDDVFHAGAGLTYAYCEGFDVALKYNFWDVSNGGNISTLGPSLAYAVCPNALVDFGVDVPVADDDASDLDLVVRFGLNVKF